MTLGNRVPNVIASNRGQNTPSRKSVGNAVAERLSRMSAAPARRHAQRAVHRETRRVALDRRELGMSPGHDITVKWPGSTSDFRHAVSRRGLPNVDLPLTSAAARASRSG